MDDLKELIDHPSCCWGYIDELRMALASACKERDEMKKELHEAKSELDKYREAEQEGRLHITPAFVWHNGDSGLHEVPYKPWMAQWIATGTKLWLTREEAEAAIAGKGGDR